MSLPKTRLGLATLLASFDDRWRKEQGYTGKPVRRKSYWEFMAAHLAAYDKETTTKPQDE